MLSSRQSLGWGETPIIKSLVLISSDVCSRSGYILVSRARYLCFLPILSLLYIPTENILRIPMERQENVACQGGTPSVLFLTCGASIASKDWSLHKSNFQMIGSLPCWWCPQSACLWAADLPSDVALHAPENPGRLSSAPTSWYPPMIVPLPELAPSWAVT